MIIAVVIFLAGADPVLTLTSRDGFESMDACRLALAEDMPRLRAAALSASATTGRVITLRAGCIRRGVGA